MIWRRHRPPTTAGVVDRSVPGKAWITWATSLDDDAWRQVDVRDGSKGPLVVDAVKRRVVSRTPRRQQGHEEMLVVMRYRDRDNQQVVKVDYYLSNAEPRDPSGGSLPGWPKLNIVSKNVSSGVRAKPGLADYEVRNWTGWHHHQTLSFIATWFLVTETLRGKNGRPRLRYRRFAKASR